MDPINLSETLFCEGDMGRDRARHRPSSLEGDASGISATGGCLSLGVTGQPCTLYGRPIIKSSLTIRQEDQAR